MEIGFNDDVSYRDLTFHIQTEDHGQGDERVSTQLFYSGRILDSKTVSYAHLLVGLDDEEERRAKIRKVMVAAHRNFYRKLKSGDYDETIGLKPVAAEGAKTMQLEAIEVIDDFQPSQSRVPESAVKVMEEDGKVTFTFDDGNMMDLRALSKELNKINVMPEGDGNAFGDQFTDLGFDDDEPEPQPATAQAAPPIIQQVLVAPPEPEPLVPDFGATGRLAFQGLLEPDPTVDVVALVQDFLRQQPTA